MGVSGYGTTQELVTLREKVWRYSPDMVLLAVTTNNDVHAALWLVLVLAGVAPQYVLAAAEFVDPADLDRQVRGPGTCGTLTGGARERQAV